MSNIEAKFCGESLVKHVIPFFSITNDRTRHVIIFLSGSGTNAERILTQWQMNNTGVSRHVILFTDRPEKSRARLIADKFNLSLIENDIKLFYQERGCDRVTLATPVGCEIREEWTDSVRKQLQRYPIDFGLFAGFIPLTNITADFPCLNVHPGDLTYLKNERRYLVGLHTVPIERAILEGLFYLRSSVIVARPYGSDESVMDDGPILGISEKIDIDLLGYTLKELQRIADSRPTHRPLKGYRDQLEQVAKFNQEKLKREGDWVIFPQVAHEFSAGNFAQDRDGKLYYKKCGEWIPIRTVVFSADKKPTVVT